MVYVKGLEKKVWLQKIMEHPVKIIDLDCPSLKKLNDACLNNHNHMYCASGNVEALKLWIVDNIY